MSLGIYLALVLVLFNLTLCLQPSKAENVVVNTKYGALRGKSATINNSTITRFLGVPYAQAPIKSYRFLRPRTILNWTQTINATQFAPSCPQNLTKALERLKKFGKGYLDNKKIHDKTSEDCLYLNIYIPGDVKKTKRLPVIVYIHDATEDWDAGFGMNYDGTNLAIKNDIIVVNFNYRLGILGFLAAGNETHWGNFGMWDQIEALRWIHENIHNFGGDNGRITVFGHGTGGISVGLLVLSNATKGLFQRAISQSGVALHLPESKMRDLFEKHTTYFYTALNCTGRNASAVLGCLQDVPLDVLMENARDYYLEINNGTSGGLFLPVVDGEFINDAPDRLLKSGHFRRDVTYMIGGTSGGTTRGFDQLSPEQILTGIKEQDFVHTIKKSLPEEIAKEEAIVDLIRHEYNDENGNPLILRRNFLQMHSDRFWSPIYQTADLISKTGDVQVYVNAFLQKSSFSVYPSFVDAMPMEDIVYQFGDVTDEEMNVNATSHEEFISTHVMQEAIRMFASYNTTRDSFLSVWLPYTPTNKKYMIFSTSSPSLQTNYRPRGMRFWSQIVPNITAMSQRIKEIEINNTPVGPLVTVGQLKLTVDEANIALWILGICAGIFFILCIILLWVVCLLSFSCCQCCACCWYKDLPRGKGNRIPDREIQTFDSTNGVRNRYDSETSTNF